MTELPSFDDETDFAVRTTARIDNGFQLEVDVLSQDDDGRRTLLAQCDHVLDCLIDAGSHAWLVLACTRPRRTLTLQCDL
jgi:hypothetical protein